MNRLTVLAAAALAAAPICVLADTPSDQPLLASPFTDNMVLQRGLADPIWGWTTPGAKVTVTIDGKSASAVAGPTGEWMAKLPPMPAGGPFSMKVAGPQSLTLNNILVGDVWVCSGQSNMEFGVGFLTNAADEIAAANYPQIRLCLTPHQTALAPKTANDMQWEVCSPDTIKNGGWNGFSAVGYFFGRDIYQKTHVPIGLIEASWGGTPAESWVSRQALVKSLPEYTDALAQLDAERAAEQTGARLSIEDIDEQWYRRNDPGSASGLGWADPALDDSGWGAIKVPGYYQLAGIPELTNINALVWYRKTIEIPAADAGKAAVLRLKADDDDTTWVNGVLVGRTEGFQKLRAYDVAAGVLKPGLNTIAVRVLDTAGLGGIYGEPGDVSLSVPGGADISLAGTWKYKLSQTSKKLPPMPQPVAANQNYATELFNGMINPLIPYGIKGAIWYQGEANGLRGYQYRTLLPTLIGDWRDRWSEGVFPFYIVQLAAFTDPPAQPGDDFWAEVREAQLKTAETTPDSGLAVAIDIGEAHDIHPKNKQEVGRRLSLVALAKTYGETGTEYSGPVYLSEKVEGASIRLAFTHTTGGLVAKGPGGKLTGFAVAGPDHKWTWADAKIDGITILVSSPTLTQPVAVRYAWAANPVCNLYNGAGLPASPFRTDDWPMISLGNK